MKEIDLNLSQKFSRESAETLADMKATGTGHALDDVRVYFSQLKKHLQGQSERPAMLQPKKCPDSLALLTRIRHK
jgi:hypothetical protein